MATTTETSSCLSSVRSLAFQDGGGGCAPSYLGVAYIHDPAILQHCSVEPSALRVVDPLPPIEEFTGPVYDQVHQVQFAAGEMPENIAEFPVVQEQVIVQAIPEVVDSLPPVEEFTEPVFNQVHHERFAAGETTENLVEFPVVQEQVVVQALPEVVDSLPPVEEFTGLGFSRVRHELLAAVPSTTEFFPLSDDEGGELSAGLRPATGAGAAAHRGAGYRDLCSRSGPRCSCAASWEGN